MTQKYLYLPHVDKKFMKKTLTISDNDLEERAKKIKQVIKKDHQLYYTKKQDLKSVACTWDPKIDKVAKGLVQKCTIETFHNCAYYGLFKPSIAEVLAQLPKDTEDQFFSHISAFRIKTDDVAIVSPLAIHRTETILYYEDDLFTDPPDVNGRDIKYGDILVHTNKTYRVQMTMEEWQEAGQPADEYNWLLKPVDMRDNYYYVYEKDESDMLYGREFSQIKESIGPDYFLSQLMKKNKCTWIANVKDKESMDKLPEWLLLQLKDDWVFKNERG